MTYVPDPLRYQQLNNGDPYGGVDCTAWGAAFRVDAHTKGSIKTTGTQVRAHSDEPKPDPRSPGLNLGQVDAAVVDITHGQVDFDTRVQGAALSRADVKWRIQDGRFAGFSILRGVLVGRGFVSGFRGGHDATFFVRDTEPDQLLMFDSLVRAITRVSWDVAFDAAEALTGGLIYAQFTRDLTPDYHVRIPGKVGGGARTFQRFMLDNHGRITNAVLRSTFGFDRPCSPPAYHPSVNAKIAGQYLVRISAGTRAGWYVSNRFAEEIIP